MPVISTEAKRSGDVCSLLRAIAALALVALGSLHSFAQQAPTPMSEEQAKKFALAAVTPKQRALPGFGLEPPEKTNGLDIFNAVWEGLPNGSVEIGFYAVDPITGTVWDAVMECQRRTTPQLRTLQRRRRQALRLSAAQLKRFEAKGPQCS